MESEPRRSLTGVTIPKPDKYFTINIRKQAQKILLFITPTSDRNPTGLSVYSEHLITHREHKQNQDCCQNHTHTRTQSPFCLLMFSAAMPPCGAAGYMEGMLVVMKSAICCRAKRLVGVLPFCSWSWIIVSSSSQKACRR